MTSKRKQAPQVNVVPEELQQEASDPEDDSPRTPSKRVRLNVVGNTGDDDQRKHAARLLLPNAPEPTVNEGVVTPAKRPARHSSADHHQPEQPPRRVLFPSSTDVAARPTAVITPARPSRSDSQPVKRQLRFGRLVQEITVQENVRQVYGLVRKLTGSLGGNASGGPIYGELTMGSMQKMVDLMKEHTGLDAHSRFIDVGSGIGKPSLHVAQDPKVAFSYGVEVDADRWLLGMSCLKQILHAAEQQPPTSLPDDERIGYRCLFEHADIRKAKTFDPFTHVYMFSIGYVQRSRLRQNPVSHNFQVLTWCFSSFPPALWVDLAEMWNRSSSASYMICYHSPKDIIESYEFQVKLIAQTTTSMHGSKEGHSAYIYERPQTSRTTDADACDAAFAEAWHQVQQDLPAIRRHVESEIAERMSTAASKRTRRQRSNSSL